MKNFMKKGFFKRIVSMLLVVAMMLTMLPAEVYAASGVTIHFANVPNWGSVRAYVWTGTGTTHNGGWPGNGISASGTYHDYYTYKNTSFTGNSINVIFNNGGNDQDKTNDITLDLSASREWWIVPKGAWSPYTYIASTTPILSPDVNGKTVTFNYASDMATSVYFMSDATTWSTSEDKMTEKNDLFTYTGTFQPGAYGYKFYVNTSSGGSYHQDPLNNSYSGDNSKFVVTGFKDAIANCKLGEETVLPSTLTGVNSDGTTSAVAVTYTAKAEDADYITINGNTVTVAKNYPGNKMSLTVKGTVGGKTVTDEYTLSLFDEPYTYTVYAHSAIEEHNSKKNSGFYVWDAAGETALEPENHAFTEEVVLEDGRTWLKAELEITAAEKIGLIFKEKNSWDVWQTKDLFYTNATPDNREDDVIYLVEGYSQVFTSLEDVPMDHHVYIEYTRKDGNYDDTWAYVWNNGWTRMNGDIEEGYNWAFEEVNGEYIATIPVAMGDTDKTIGFIVQKNTDWTGKDGGDNFVEVLADQPYVKVRFEDGGISYKLPGSVGSEIVRKKDVVNFYYRDEELFLDNAMETLGEVQLVVRTQDDTSTSAEQVIDMVYSAKDERYACQVDLSAETDYYYYYLVNGTEKVLDTWNKKTGTIEGVEYSLRRNRTYQIDLTAELLNDAMDSNDNNIVSVSWAAKSGNEADLEGFCVEKAYADLSALGLSSKTEISTELMEMSFGCLDTVEPGVKSIPVTIVDDCDMTYTTTVEVNVEARAKTENTEEKFGEFGWDEAVIYFAVTDRFYNKDKNNDHVESASSSLGIHGGDFAGLKDKIQYLYNLGVNTIWITPIVDNIDEPATGDGNEHYAYHGYWTSDFRELNPHLGSEEDLRALVAAAHEKGMKVMVDVVLNHAGYGTEATFNNIIPTNAVNGDGSTIYKPMLRDASNTVPNDEVLDSLSGLPDFVTEDEEVRNQLIEWQTTWMKEFGIDYYRVDTVKHVDETTWEAFKNALVKENEEFKLIGEYYGAGFYHDYDQLDSGKMDAVLDFNFNDLMTNLASENLIAIEDGLMQRNATLTNTATMGSFLSSHDENGFIYTLINDYEESESWAKSLAKVAATYQITAKGQPVIYYGEELGMTGANDYPVQSNRYDFDWNEQETQAGNANSMYKHYEKMLNIRKAYSEVFAKGDRTVLVMADSYDGVGPKEKGYEVFSRSYEDTTIYVGINVWGDAKSVKFFVEGTPGSEYTDLYNEKTYTVADDGSITISIPNLTKGGTAVLVQTSGDKVTATDNNEVTVKIHYKRTDGNYTDWNAYLWGDSFGGKGHKFEDEGGEKVATIKVDGRATNNVFFRIRKGDWKENDHEGRDQSFDISDIVSGTVHYYINSGVWGGVRVLGTDAIVDTAIVQAKYDRTTNKIMVTTNTPIKGNADTAFEIMCVSDNTHIDINQVTESGSTYTLTLDEDLTAMKDVLKSYTIKFRGVIYNVTMPNIYSSAEFENTYAYSGDDLGLTYGEDASVFKVWAPTADTMTLNIYASGTAGTEDLQGSYPMTLGEKGVWEYTLAGDHNGEYYTYSVNVNNKTSEVCDPYARTTGVNGERAMILNLDTTDPEGWENDKGPHTDMAYTDAVIYELHVRDLSSDASSGIKDEYRGKFLGLTQTGTKTAGGEPTGLDHMIDLGITHLHILPMYDYASVDESRLDEDQFNWGYDPLNYNVPEGSYSTNPYDGASRVSELKQMVQTLHNNNINVVMDVVYNHVYDAGTFGFNVLVPKYFSRTNEDGSYSNGSGCGNDTASERAMVHKYIVESILYWHNEYHIDGFRFDLVGLLDTETINTLVDAVHAIDPDIIFYGEGWTLGTAVSKENYHMATQTNAAMTPDFAYFSDTLRNGVAGSNVDGVGFIWNVGNEDLMRQCFTATTSWCPSPSQTINYVSCHDNYTLMDKINEVSKAAYDSYDDMPGSYQVKLNNLAAAFYMFSEGIPFVHAGEEFLRTKLDEDGTIIHNSYNSSDYVNTMRWYNLDTEIYADTVDYYEGLIEFRKNHAALRLSTKAEVASNVTYHWVTNEVVLYTINGKSNVAGEVADGIVIIYNASNASKTINLYGNDGVGNPYNIKNGTWNICVNDKDAGTDVLGTITNGSVTVPAHSAMALVKGQTVDKHSVYEQNNRVAISFDKTNVIMNVDKEAELAVDVKPADSTLIWTSSNESVASVVDGKVTATGVGETTITVSTLHGVTATCVVTVTNEEIPESVTLDKETITLEEEQTETLVATVTPDGTKVTWVSSNEEVATVDENGVVTAVGEGEATITVTTPDGATDCCIVTVTAKVVPDPDPTPDPDPVPPTQEEQVRAFVERMYTIILGRDADPNGLNDWAAGLIEWRVDGAGIVNGFANSEEFVARGLSDEDFIKTLYLAVLNREADEAGLADWLRAFELGYTRQMLIDGFVTSAEFIALCDSYGILAEITQRHLVTSFVERMYTVALDREADAAGLEYWVTKLMAGSTDGKTVVNGFVGSPEFEARGLSDEDFIKTLYRTILGREANEADVASWIAAIELGQTRTQIMNGFIESAEFAYLCDGYGISAILTQRDLVTNFVSRMYTVALNREADANGLNDWVTGLIDGVIYGAQVADGFIMSAEFEARGLSNEDYIKTLYLTFFNREAGDADVEGWVAAMTVHGQSRRDVLRGFINAEEFRVLCEDYGIIRGELAN